MHVIVWEFRVRPGSEVEFIRQYGPEGAWARLFRASSGYVRTELLQDVVRERRFVTFDYWKSEEEFDRFRKEHPAEYDRLDEELENLTDNERRLGAF